ncbi:hypothetical protein FisN_34Hu034 [Fistulifera solaris]|uniref:HIG1 domain-containing protein n=1 Tax=Fistulifera solaris TaxID=1519565 RepID=A0A1Z5JB89_FISSO|nr:hypothetical protein FisN_34Hu034 [Fistulifera solaris]|eukprot:GAX11245.1 hypothetical protein FisN_34Hu034 [Fistulifera solaris]
MVSLTPIERSQEVATDATNEGLLNGFFTLVPSTAAVYWATQNIPAFRARTNLQSRTAMALMPALFVFAFTSEHKLTHRMKQVAYESQHSRETVQWAEQQLSQQPAITVTQLYERSIAESGVCIVPTLRWHHRFLNYANEHPIQVLSSLAVPTVGYIFYGRSGKEHLALSSKIMHTRVFGQFATLLLLLSVMGLKEFMDRNGKYITEQDAHERVQEMHRMRAEWLQQLQRDQKEETK